MVEMYKKEKKKGHGARASDTRRKVMSKIEEKKKESDALVRGGFNSGDAFFRVFEIMPRAAQLFTIASIPSVSVLGKFGSPFTDKLMFGASALGLAGIAIAGVLIEGNACRDKRHIQELRAVLSTMEEINLSLEDASMKTGNCP